MKPDEIRELLRQTPAIIHTADGREYLVQSNEFVLVGTRTVAVLFRNPDNELINTVLASHLISSITPTETSSP